MTTIIKMILSVLTKPKGKFFPVVDEKGIAEKPGKFFPMTEREYLLENRHKGIWGNGKCSPEDFFES